MKLGQDLQSPTPDSSVASCRPIFFKKKYAAQFHRLLKEWLFELVDFQICGSSIVCNVPGKCKKCHEILFTVIGHNFGTQQKWYNTSKYPNFGHKK